MSIELTIWPPLIVPFVRTIVLCVDVPDEDLITELVQQGPADLEPVSLPPDIHPMVKPLPSELSRSPVLWRLLMMKMKSLAL